MSHCLIWHNRVSLANRHSALLLVTRLETPIPHVAEQGDQSVVCRKQVEGSKACDWGEEIHSENLEDQI